MQASVVDVLLDAKNSVADPARWITGKDCRVNYSPQAAAYVGTTVAHWNDLDLRQQAPTVKQIMQMDDAEFTTWSFCMRGAVAFACMTLDESNREETFALAMSELGLTVKATACERPWRMLLSQGYASMADDVPSWNDAQDENDLDAHRQMLGMFDATVERLKDNGASFSYDGFDGVTRLYPTE